MAEAGGLERALALEYVRQLPDEAAAELEKGRPADTADWLAGLGAPEVEALLGRLASDTSVRVLAAMPPEAAAAALAALDPPQASRLASRLERPVRETLLGRLPADLARDLRQIASYPPGTAGALMDPQVLALRPRTTAAEALARLRDLGHKSISRVYLVDPAEVLVGSVRVRDLAVADPSSRLEELMLEGPAGVPVTADREDVSEVLDRERVASLPVVDFEGRLVGVLDYDVLIDAARDDATVDMQAMVGAGREERALSPVGYAVKKRLPWLQVNLLTAFLAASVVGLFESTIAAYTALAVLLPVVAGQSGNTGAQALAVTMRGLALREIRARQWLRVCLKESSVALLNGLAVALTTSLAVLLWSGSVGLALVIGSSMVLSMVVAGLSGAATPMALTALGQDPAQSSSIILTTVTDVVGFFSFLGIATLLSGML